MQALAKPGTLYGPIHLNQNCNPPAALSACAHPDTIDFKLAGAQFSLQVNEIVKLIDTGGAVQDQPPLSLQPRPGTRVLITYIYGMTGVNRAINSGTFWVIVEK